MGVSMPVHGHAAPTRPCARVQSHVRAIDDDTQCSYSQVFGRLCAYHGGIEVRDGNEAWMIHVSPTEGKAGKAGRG